MKPGRGGLTATELASVTTALQAELQGAIVQDTGRLRDRDDLLLFVETSQGRRALQIATDTGRARICFTRRRFAKALFNKDPHSERIARQLREARITNVSSMPGERRAEMALSRDGVALRLVVELFGSRGLWCLLDSDGVILEMSRIPKSKYRELRPGQPYAEPSSPPQASTEEARFQEPLLATVDRHFTELDRLTETGQRRDRLLQLLTKNARKLEHRAEGAATQIRQAERAPALRRQADLLLAYGFTHTPDGDVLQVPDPDDPDATVGIPLDPKLSVQEQAERLYRKARKLQDGVHVAEQRRTQAMAELQLLRDLSPRLLPEAPTEALDEAEATLQELGLLPRPKPKAEQHQTRKLTKGENFRRFRSAEDYLILVGRSNQQNDRLSTAVARGNDLWLHVGAGYTGSHVVVRLPKGKPASLETMLDAGTLAIYFSKARGNARCDVIYTQAKNVRKSKGMPPGKVAVAHQKTITVRLEPNRLERLLGTSET